MDKNKEIQQPEHPEIEQQDFPEFEQATEHPQGDDTRVAANGPVGGNGTTTGDQIVL